MVKKIICSVFLISWCASIAQNKISDILNYSEKVEKILIASEEVAYIDEGSGDNTLIFIHGLSSNLEAWKKNVLELKEDYRCIALDLPGYGKSSRNNTSYSLKDYADFLKCFIESKQLKNVVLVGHSMGGQIAIHAVLSSPELFEKLILIAPAGIETFSEQEAAVLKSSYSSAIVVNSTPEQVTANYKLNFHTFPEDAKFMVEDRIKMKGAVDFPDYAEVVVNNVHAMLDEPVFNQLDKLAKPVLILYGNNDLLIPNRFFHPDQTIESLVKDAEEKIPDLKVEIINEAGHFVNFEKPGEVNREIIKFLKNG